jgi:hypothetical protein
MGLFRRSKPATENPVSPASSAGRQNYTRSNSTGTAGTNSSSLGSPTNGGFEANAVARKRSSARSSAMATLNEGAVPKSPDPNVDPAAYLRSIHAVRERCYVVYDKATKNELNHFDVDWEKLDETVKWVDGIIRVRFIDPSIVCVSSFIC